MTEEVQEFDLPDRPVLTVDVALMLQKKYLAERLVETLQRNQELANENASLRQNCEKQTKSLETLETRKAALKKGLDDLQEQHKMQENRLINVEEQIITLQKTNRLLKRSKALMNRDPRRLMVRCVVTVFENWIDHKIFQAMLQCTRNHLRSKDKLKLEEGATIDQWMNNHGIKIQISEIWEPSDRVQLDKSVIQVGDELTLTTIMLLEDSCRSPERFDALRSPEVYVACLDLLNGIWVNWPETHLPNWSRTHAYFKNMNTLLKKMPKHAKQSRLVCKRRNFQECIKSLDGFYEPTNLLGVPSENWAVFRMISVKTRHRYEPYGWGWPAEDPENFPSYGKEIEMCTDVNKGFFDASDAVKHTIQYLKEKKLTPSTLYIADVFIGNLKQGMANIMLISNGPTNYSSDSANLHWSYLIESLASSNWSPKMPIRNYRSKRKFENCTEPSSDALLEYDMATLCHITLSVVDNKTRVLTMEEQRIAIEYASHLMTIHWPTSFQLEYSTPPSQNSLWRSGDLKPGEHDGYLNLFIINDF